MLDVALPVRRNVRVEDVPPPRRVLVVRPNFRIGNTVITSPIVPALRGRFPGAELHLLGADTTAGLLAGLPVDAVHAMSRRFILRPWQFVALMRRLRALRFDVAVEAGLGSFSGSLFTYLSGARYRVGVEGSGERFLNVRLPRPRPEHCYDRLPGFASEQSMMRRGLGVLPSLARLGVTQVLPTSAWSDLPEPAASQVAAWPCTVNSISSSVETVSLCTIDKITRSGRHCRA